MNLLYVKSILALFFIPAGLVAVLCMFALMGRSGRAATAANIIGQLRSPLGTMPAFTSLSDRQVADIIAYLKTL